MEACQWEALLGGSTLSPALFQSPTKSKLASGTPPDSRFQPAALMFMHLKSPWMRQTGRSGVSSPNKSNLAQNSIWVKYPACSPSIVLIRPRQQEKKRARRHLKAPFPVVHYPLVVARWMWLLREVDMTVQPPDVSIMELLSGCKMHIDIYGFFVGVFLNKSKCLTQSRQGKNIPNEAVVIFYWCSQENQTKVNFSAPAVGAQRLCSTHVFQKNTSVIYHLIIRWSKL